MRVRWKCEGKVEVCWCGGRGMVWGGCACDGVRTALCSGSAWVLYDE